MKGVGVFFVCLFLCWGSVLGGDGWVKYLSDGQNTGSTNLQGPTKELCKQLVVSNNYSTPLLTPPIISPHMNLYIASSNVSITNLQKTSTASPPQVIWSANIPFEFRTHMLLDSSNSTWAGSNNCTLIVVRDHGTTFTIESLRLNDSCTLPLTGGLSQSADGSILVVRTIDGYYYGIDMITTPLSSQSILWQAMSPFDQRGFNNDYGTLLIDPNDGFQAWGVSGGILYSLDLHTGNFSAMPFGISLQGDIVASSLVTDASNGRTYFTTASNQVYCFLLSTGQLEWQASYASSTFYHRPSTPALSPENKILYVVISYTFCAFDSTSGKLQYTVPLEEERNMPLYMSVDGADHVYFTSESYLYGIDGSTGDSLYKNDTLGLVYLDSAVTIAGNSALVLQSGSQFMIVTDQTDSCSNTNDSDDSGDEDIFIWVVTSILAFIIVAFTVLTLAELIRRFRKREYENIQ